MEKNIKFGTDGWRAVIAEDFTFDNVRACAQGVADYLKQARLAERGLVIGYDTRFASEDFAAATAEVIAGNDIKVLLCCKAAPTPVISYAVTDTRSAGAVIITASHNPGRWNGFKFKDSFGASASSQVAREIERRANEALSTGDVQRLLLADGLDRGLIAYYDPDPPYFSQLEKLVDIESLRQYGFNVVVDSMYGAGIGYFKTLLESEKTEIIEINSERNPLFPEINPEPIARNLARLSSMVKQRKADVGLATDGDADRIGIIDEHGEFLNQLQVFALLVLYFLEVRGERGAVIKTISTTVMVDYLGKLFGIRVYETPVGFKYVAPLMTQKDALIGGEESGGYGFRGHIPERDGILAGLYLLDFMRKTGKTPSQLLNHLFSKVGPHYYDRIDIHIASDERQKISDRISRNPVSSIGGIKVARLDTTDGFRYILADDSWLLIRFSGTEPLVRIYAESQSPEKVSKLLDSGKELLGI